ncbi:MAG: preprotein translocase subunit YajC [Alphaproteobacteria bacterium]
MLISKAYAAAQEATGDLTDLANAPTPMEAFVWNMGLVVILVGLFYVLLIMPQQRRFKEHSEMLGGLKKGDRVVTGGGLVGKVDKLLDEKEVVVDLGNGVKVTALRSMIQGKADLKPVANDTPAPDNKEKNAKKGK